MSMAMRMQRQRTEDLRIARAEFPTSPSHPFYQRLNELLESGKFDDFLRKASAGSFNKNNDAPALPLGTYFRLLLIGYFEGIDSGQGIARRVADSLSLRQFLGIAANEATPDPFTISQTWRLTDAETHRRVFFWVLGLLADQGMVKGKRIRIEATPEAKAAMRTIVRRDHAQTYEEFLNGLAKESGMETPGQKELAQPGRQRKTRARATTDGEHTTLPSETKKERARRGTDRIAEPRNGRAPGKFQHLQDITAVSHPFYQRLGDLLEADKFDEFVEKECERFHPRNNGHPRLAAPVYFRLLLAGYLEGIDSERGIAWRVADSLSLRRFLGIAANEATPDPFTISRMRLLIDVETHRKVFLRVLELLAGHGLLKGSRIGIHATTREAIGAMRSIAWQKNEDSYQEFLNGVAKESGVTTPAKEDRLGHKRVKEAKGAKATRVRRRKVAAPLNPARRRARQPEILEQYRGPAFFPVGPKTAEAAVQPVAVNEFDTSAVSTPTHVVSLMPAPLQLPPAVAAVEPRVALGRARSVNRRPALAAFTIRIPQVTAAAPATIVGMPKSGGGPLNLTRRRSPQANPIAEPVGKSGVTVTAAFAVQLPDIVTRPSSAPAPGTVSVKSAQAPEQPVISKELAPLAFSTPAHVASPIPPHLQAGVLAASIGPRAAPGPAASVDRCSALTVAAIDLPTMTAGAETVISEAPAGIYLDGVSPAVQLPCDTNGRLPAAAVEFGTSPLATAVHAVSLPPPQLRAKLVAAPAQLHVSPDRTASPDHCSSFTVATIPAAKVRLNVVDPAIRPYEILWQPPGVEPQLPVIEHQFSSLPIVTEIHRKKQWTVRIPVSEVHKAIRIAAGFVAACWFLFGLWFAASRVDFGELSTAATQWIDSTIQARAAFKSEDNFQSGLADWSGAKHLAKTWTFDKEGFMRPGQLALYEPSAGMTDYMLEFRTQIEHRGVGWVFRAADPQNYYAMKLVVADDSPRMMASLARYAVVDGQKEAPIITPLRMMLHGNRPYRILVEVKGNQFSTALEGQVVSTWSDDRFPAGAVGFFTERGERARLYWVRLSKNLDFLGGLCAILAGSGRRESHSPADHAGGAPYVARRPKNEPRWEQGSDE